LDAEALGNTGSQEMWRQNFSSLAGVSISSIEETNKEEWTGKFEEYKVVVSVNLKPGAPFMGWDEGNNTRWIPVKLVDGQWKIVELATGP